jgi:ergothioneine biosynthesis protein EgtB
MICKPLATEDYVIQSMPDVSPTKWHLAHTTWFFETFVLAAADASYQPYHTLFGYLFNSYYNAVGPQWSRPRRGILSRPTVEEVMEYRQHVDDRMADLLGARDEQELGELAGTIMIGLQHEQQHQELMLMDLKHVFSCNPLRPVYREQAWTPGHPPARTEWLGHEGGRCSIGHVGSGFCYDNEGPRHDVLLDPFQIGSRLVTCREYLAFMEDGGYDRFDLWLSDGWNVVQSERWRSPLYWERADAGWQIMTLSGLRPIDPAEPVCHVSYYEADALARWAGARLPREEEWEAVAAVEPVVGNFVESGRFHPAPADGTGGRPMQLYGDVWEWTSSPYTPYPGYRPAEGALGEYNGKFMCNQMVLRGGCCVTSSSHIRATYRNFFPPAARWVFSGIRLARDT